MNYTINEIPDTATEANNTDYAIMWQDKTKKISISNLFKKLVKKSEVTNTISPINENPITSKAVSSLLTISASTTTITDAPPLQNGITLRIFFTSEIAGTDDTTVLQISYNGTSYNVKVPKDGALQNYVAFEVSSGVFKYLQAYTTLELLFDGTQFVIVGNPVVLSGSNYLYYADGSHNTNTVASGNMQSVTSNAVANIQTKTSVTVASGIIVSKVNNIVSIYMRGAYNISGDALFTLPEGYRPETDVFQFCQYRTQNPNYAFYMGVIRIPPDGKVQGWFQVENLETQITENGELYGIATYII